MYFSFILKIEKSINYKCILFQISTLPSPSARVLRPVRSAENLVPTNHKAAAVLISCLSPQSNQSDTSGGEGGQVIGDRTSKESDELGPLEIVASALER